MKTKNHKKKIWEKPEVHILKIKKDTFSGATSGPEGFSKTLPKPPS
jgi:hypothetical protein